MKASKKRDQKKWPPRPGKAEARETPSSRWRETVLAPRIARSREAAAYSNAERGLLGTTRERKLVRIHVRAVLKGQVDPLPKRPSPAELTAYGKRREDIRQALRFRVAGTDTRSIGEKLVAAS